VAELTDVPAIVDLVSTGLAGAAATATATLGDRTVLLHSTPIPSAEGGTAGAVLLMGDITEQKRVEEAQRRFVANASHEMRTPIAALKGLLELLDSGAKEDPVVRDDFLKTMALEADRLEMLVADLLTLAQLDAGNLTLHREPVAVQALVHQIVAVMSPLAARSGVTLSDDVPEEPIEAYCDRDRIMQVLLGFVDNALKHTSEGGRVTVGACLHAGGVMLEVRDDGVGIDPDMVPRLFERFFRADESRGVPRGTGLGLSIAKEIIEAHDSSIEVVSKPGEGASFRFDLPLAR
jgi:signal transduction histidine kinase